ncbi:uncharacterized protein A1O9_00309 [Exophiala aquamarina CBS 119918]|uniref:Uncharacterized protein n=1 Tax=Exophiala aquamarina CBS 119918 TaxID=1182545 RepID=A0A072PRH8_9EURO|nr:uncharacterized protein A1O9_00309 [Exophiala aquamarina CBS 119918]KEF62337.1 hypothetical protein A1O9_00309 [Exophiala aquamarina CBS 119918]
MPPPPFGVPGAPPLGPGMIPPPGGRGAPFPPFPPNGIPPPNLPFPPPGGFPPNFQIPPPGAPGGFPLPGQQTAQNAPAPGGPNPAAGSVPGQNQAPGAPPDFHASGPPGMGDNRR